MKQRLGIFLVACFVWGLLFSAIRAFRPEHKLSSIDLQLYPTVDVDQTIDQINALHLTGVTAVRARTVHDFPWFCQETVWVTLLAIVGTTFVLMIYAALCRVLNISLKK